VLLLFILLASGASGADFKPQREKPSYGLDFWREAEGLPQSRIRAMTQTRDGYLWLGTDSGLVRFNGTSFKTFTIETGSLKDNEVWALQEDNDGGLWIGTYGGGLTLLKNGRFTTFTVADGLPDDVVRKLDKDPEGNIWIVTPNGACRYSHGTFTKFTTKEGLADNYVTALCAGSAEGVFVATNAGLQRFVNGRFEAVQGIAEKSDGRIGHLLNGRDGSIWIGFQEGVIKQWKAGVLTHYTRQHNLSHYILYLYEDLQGTLWVALPQGLHRLKDGIFEPVVFGDDSVHLGTICSLWADREGSLWIGLESNGLGRLRTKQLTTLTAADGLPNDSTRSVFQDRQGNLWIGTASGFAKYRNGSITRYGDADGLRLGTVRSFEEDADGVVWIAAAQELFLLKGGKLTKFPGWKSASEIKVLYRDARGRMWAGTDGDGLFEFENGRIRNYRTQDGLASNQVRALLSDRQGELWIGTFGGVSRYTAGKFTTYTNKDGLAGNRVLALHEDEEGALWFATRSGLSRFKEGKFFTYTADSGLFAGFVYAILDDDRGNFWFSCAQGLFRASKAELRDFAAGKVKKITSVDYGVKDGMKTRACNLGNQPTAWKATDGSLLFCSMKGVAIVDPEKISFSGDVPPVYIEDVLINKQPQPPDAEARIPLDAGEVEIHYAALSYNTPGKVRFKYRLEGYDKEWVDAGARSFAYYANLPPGEYRFRVIGGNLDGPWPEAANGPGASFGFYLKPHFYQTRWFLVLAVATAILVAGLLYRLRVIELKARYSAVLAERNRIAREIHDTLAQNLAGVALQLDSVTMQLPDMPDGLRERLDQACDLTRYSLAEARRAVTDLRSDELERQELAVALPEIAAKMAASVAIQSKVQVIGTPRRLNPMTEKNLLRIFQEAMANAVKHAQARTIEVELKYDTDHLILRVQDDGSGFDTRKIIPFGVGHYGLMGMRERAERIGGRLILKSQPGEGTELLVEVPFSA